MHLAFRITQVCVETAKNSAKRLTKDCAMINRSVNCIDELKIKGRTGV